MRLIVAQKHINLLKLIAVTCSAIYLPSCGNGFSGLQPGNSKRTFADWCRQKADLSPEAKHTVEVLLKRAETTDCAAANQKLLMLPALDLTNNKISDIKPLESLTNLRMLNLNKNQISDIKPLESLTKLHYLCLDNNQIRDIQPLQSLNNLMQLKLYNNQISDLKPLRSLDQLSELILKKNQISDIKPLRSLTRLNKLGIENNQISDIKPLRSLTQLHQLYLSGNPIASKSCPIEPESICKWEPSPTESRFNIF
ncbi:leucine-rich repeat domain-containing protein [Microcoleus sp. Pol17_C1]|uniref:leucine-rich repeat domain-containing protein n=1 Tax=unclassified Microcoleus TaxID=2642155 RepID=UPI002FD1BD4B